ncbi:STAS domain-containing protein [Mesobacillus subterraneus]|uniref:STAS domain-containing protein n=1 Tax=Mesobacillus subterraneus TaxID=285983 RepID=A0A3R9KYN5_9BACI|nr:STAS domain-containing protein [Mesobacillus subterraneus]RSD29059.1 STAS domain-containing protein [Mesobacillus subterraneus]
MIDPTKAKIISEQILLSKKSLVDTRTTETPNQYTPQVQENLYKWRHNLVEIYAYSIIDNLDTSFSILKDWGDEAVNFLINLDLPLDIAIDEVRTYRDKIGSIIKNQADQFKLSFDDFYGVISRFNFVVDRAIYWLSISYTSRYSKRYNALEALNLELSIPVIKITEEIGVLPLIGDIDTKRAQEIMESALTKVNQLGLSHVIIDLSGVPVIDTMVASRLFKVSDALNLTGIKTIFTGIRPEIAVTMVHLGINMKEIPIFSSLHLAVKKMQNTKS